jgi:CheY-like chemotaxis protein
VFNGRRLVNNITVTPSTDLRILVVDDDQAIRNLLCAVLRRRGLEVDPAEHGAEALAMLGERPYAVILLDLMMPLVDGHLFLQRLAELRLDPRPVVLVISASDESDFRKLERGSVSAIIRKPFDIMELADLVSACVGSGHLPSVEAAEGATPSTPGPRLPITGERPAMIPPSVAPELPDPPDDAPNITRGKS